MKALILAAGRGERLRPLTNQTPKPLIQAGGVSLIEYHLMQLAQAGITEIVINLRYRGDMIRAALGNGQAYGVQITYSDESKIAYPMNTGGGIKHALPWLDKAPFLVLSADIYCQFPYEQLLMQPKLAKNACHLVCVDNPIYHPKGDFHLHDNGALKMEGIQRVTYGNLGVFHPALFAEQTGDNFALSQLLDRCIRINTCTGQLYRGPWFNVGDAAQLSALQQFFNQRECMGPPHSKSLMA